MAIRRIAQGFVGTLITLSLAVAGEAKVDANSLLGMWLFEENKGDTVKDASGKGMDGTLTNDVKWTAGQIGKGVEFKVPAYVDMGPQAGLDVGVENFSVATWFKYSGKPPDWHSVLIHKAVFAAPRHGYILCVRGMLDAGNVGKPLWWMGLGTNDGIHLFGTSTINDGKWHHLVGTADRKGKMRLFRDGVLESELDIAGSVKENETNASGFYIGGEKGTRTLEGGAMDEVAIFNVALSDDDVAAIYKQGLERALGILAVSANRKLAQTWAALRVP